MPMTDVPQPSSPKPEKPQVPDLGPLAATLVETVRQAIAQELSKLPALT
jgi:hypothetical protein